MLRTHAYVSGILLTSLVCACSSGNADGTGGASGGTGGAGGGAVGPTLVETDKGPVQGAVVGESRLFMGIPYAAPPVGDLRWKSPAPAKPWTDPLSTLVPGPSCPQLNPLSPAVLSGTKEDCLTLNVWTPAKVSGTPAPVLVWLHGGAFMLGSGGDAAYDGQLFSEATGSVVITINYRLGPLGFLSHNALKAEDPSYPSSGMYGFEDQRAALAWTKANAAAFGGDPNNVTLFGESAGGMSTCFHVVSPPSKGLFHRAIIESGACAFGATTPDGEGEAQGDAFAAALGCTDPSKVLECMRGKTADDALLALPLKKGILFGDGARWFPSVDGVNIDDDPKKLIEAGAFHSMPTMLGTNRNEGTLFFALADAITNDAEYAATMEGVFPTLGGKILAQYPSASFPSPQDAAAEAIGDGLFICSARRTARALAGSGAPTYLYHFTHPIEKALFPNLGAFHSAEISFVLGNNGPLVPSGHTTEEEALSTEMMSYWSRMATGGDPNGDGAFAWPKYETDTEENIVFDLTISKQAGLKKDACDFWDAL